MLLTDCRQAPGNIGQRLVPADLLEAAVGLAFQRVAQPVFVVLIVFEAGRLLADISLRYRVFLIAANARELPVFNRDAEAAIARTKDACGFLGDAAGL